MNTKFRWFWMEGIDQPDLKTLRFLVQSHTGSCLGEIRWYNHWRQYCFYPMGETVFNSDCLKDINYFVDQLMEERNNK